VARTALAAAFSGVEWSVRAMVSGRMSARRVTENVYGVPMLRRAGQAIRTDRAGTDCRSRRRKGTS